MKLFKVKVGDLGRTAVSARLDNGKLVSGWTNDKDGNLKVGQRVEFNWIEVKK